MASRSFATGKFGRAMVDFRLPNGDMLCKRLVRERLAVPYEGQSKAEIRALHEANWDALDGRQVAKRKPRPGFRFPGPVPREALESIDARGLRVGFSHHDVSGLEHRPEHVCWNGTLLPADDPWWHGHFTPSGWGCRCWARQVSRAEARRLGGLSDPPAKEVREWTNPRTGKAMEVDRGLHPAWASNPDLDRVRIVADRLNRALDAADDALARAAVRQVVESSLLERHLSGPGEAAPSASDLPAGYLERESMDALAARTKVVRMTTGTAKKQVADLPDITVGDFRSLLPALPGDADLVCKEPARDGSCSTELVFARQFDNGRICRVAICRQDERRVGLTKLHRLKVRHANAAAKRGERLRNWRGWSRQ